MLSKKFSSEQKILSNQATCMTIGKPFAVPCHEMVHNFLPSHCTIPVAHIVIDPCYSFPYLVWTGGKRDVACCSPFLDLLMAPRGFVQGVITHVC